MSGIFGFTQRTPDQSTREEILGGLRYWNRIYGDAARADANLEGACLGCHVEHFSDRFPYGGPILSKGGKHAVVDALLFNREELLALPELAELGGASDEELLLRLIECRGFDALEMVNGDFAGAIWDAEKGEWTLFRDHMGVRPLFYYMDDELFLFSTDIRGIVAAPGVDIRFNAMLFYKYIAKLDILSLEHTEFEHIHCIHPGSVCRVRRKDAGFAMEKKLYWQLRRKKIRLSSEEAYRQELRRLVTDAVHRRCDAIPGTLGGELSGGLDSSIIDILVNRHGRKGVYYSWSPDPERYPLQDGEDERKVVLDICRQEDISCRFLHIEDRVNYDYLLKHVMPPYVTTLQLTYGSKWMKSQGANAVFTGHGGDEGVSHRANRFELLYNGEIGAYLKLFWNDCKGKKLRLLRTLWWAGKFALERSEPLRAKPPKEMLYPSVFKRAFCDAMIAKMTVKPRMFGFAPYRYVMQGGSRPRLDNCAYQGAFCGVRYLFPYIDYRVMDYAVSIPRRLYVGQDFNRRIFRETFRDLMPQSLQDTFYKDLASIRSENPAQQVNLSFHNRVDRLLTKLDQDQWKDVLDFDGMRGLHETTITDKNEIAQWTLLMNKLEISLLIQNVQQQARQWKERADADEVL